MFSWSNRLSSIITDAISILGLMAICFGASSYFLATKPSDMDISVKVKQLLKFNRLDYVRNYSPDRAAFVFQFDSNLTPLFHWNVKVLHIMLFAEYATDSNELNQVILWDEILERKYLLEGKQSAHLRNNFVNGKYTLIDYGNELRDKTVTLKLRWNVVPYVGLLYDQEAIVGEYVLPKQYKRSGPERSKVVYDETYDEELIRTHWSQQ